MARPAPEEAVRVSSLELFFDLVFVFTVTQLTTVLVDRPDLAGLARVVIVLALVFYMYGGYAWLTNAIAVDRAGHRLLLLGGMGGFLVLALTIPADFDGAGATFGLAYVFVVALHAGLFTRARSASAVQAVLALAPSNLGAALLVLAGGVAGGDAQWVLWGAAVVLEWVAPRLRAVGRFDIAPGHFVERHGLVVIVALGESVVAVGIGAEGLPVDAALVGVALLGLALSALLWWTYFSDEEELAPALAAVDGERRARTALRAFGDAHVALLLAIIVVSAAIKKTIGHAGDPLDWPVAAGFALGVSGFLLADVGFRRLLGLRAPDRLRVLAAVAAPLAIPLGGAVASAAELAALVALLAAALWAEGRVAASPRRRAGPRGPAPRGRGG
jgi:low temperature requirement protein LtrA